VYQTRFLLINFQKFLFVEQSGTFKPIFAHLNKIEIQIFVSYEDL